MTRFWDWFQFQLEQFIVRGPFHRLLMMAAIIVTISLVGGLIVFVTGDFGNGQDAVWWAFLRLTDPGYLGDDEGVVKRVISTIITVLGYVVFMGALIAIMTQWFHATIARIESGVSPVSMRNHFVILGWTNRTTAIVDELIQSESRVRRFYEKMGADVGLRVVILSDEPVSKVREDLRRVLGKRYDSKQIVVRVGNAFRAGHLVRVDFMHAAAILLPADPTGVNHPSNLDALTIKTLLSLMQAARELGIDDTKTLPLVVAELTDDRKVHIADVAYHGPLETLSTDRIVARLIAQSVRHRGVSAIYKDFLAHSWGNEVYARHWHGARTEFRVVAGSYRDALPIGVAKGEDGALDIELNPDLDHVVERGDRIVLLAPDYAVTNVATDDGVFADVSVGAVPPKKEMPPTRRLLMLGWSRKAPVLLAEFDAYENEQFNVDLMSLMPIEDRERELERRHGKLKRTTVRHIEADFTSESDLDALDLSTYDTILVLSSDWLETDQLSDARTLLGYLVVQSAIERRGCTPALVVELRDGDSEELLGAHQCDVVVSPEMVSHMLTHIGLRRELGEIFEMLFGPHGAEIFFLPISSYGIEAGRVPFSEVRQRVAAFGETAVGVRISGSVMMNPKVEDSLELGADDEVVVLAVFEADEHP